MSEQRVNKLERFRRLSQEEDWPACVICREHVSKGFSIYSHDEGHLIITTFCDGCLNHAKRDVFVRETIR